MNPLKGDRYTVSPCMDKYPPIGDVKPFDSLKAHAVTDADPGDEQPEKEPQ